MYSKRKPKMDERTKKIKSAKINNVLGLFLLFFGLIILVAIYFTETFIGQMTNLIAGFILCAIGGLMIIKAKRALKLIT
jgi:putative Mn2+ efflux pump MntP